MFRVYISLLWFSCCTSILTAQASYAATRTAKFQVGVMGSNFSLDYGEGRESGIGIYGDVDVSHHLGAEVLYRDASLVTPHDTGENHLLGGPRFHFTAARIFEPYAKVLFGLGMIDYQKGYNRVAYTENYFDMTLGGGVDVRVARHVNIRAFDVEYHRWPNFGRNGLTPYGYSAGAAYVF